MHESVIQPPVIDMQFIQTLDPPIHRSNHPTPHINTRTDLEARVEGLDRLQILPAAVHPPGLHQPPRRQRRGRGPLERRRRAVPSSASATAAALVWFGMG